MRNSIYISIAIVWIIPLALLASILLPAQSFGQAGVSSYANSSSQYEVSSGYYKQNEMKPQFGSQLVRKLGGVNFEPFTSRSSSVFTGNRGRLSDAHSGIKFYENRRCKECHANNTHDIHTERANLTCRQCHGQEPIASIDQYYSPMNPIRRHAYVCSKCHEGASASFASYVIHEPDAGSSSTKTGFPALYYSYWFMLALLAGTLSFFIPHTILMGLREMFRRKKD
jgi:hypothetical protein